MAINTIKNVRLLGKAPGEWECSSTGVSSIGFNGCCVGGAGGSALPVKEDLAPLGPQTCWGASVLSKTGVQVWASRASTQPTASSAKPAPAIGMGTHGESAGNHQVVRMSSSFPTSSLPPSSSTQQNFKYMIKMTY